MTTIPYIHNGELIDLVPLAELEKAKLAAIGLEAENAGLRADNAELLERLEERTQSHLHASARDVQTIQQQAVELAKWQAEASRLSAEREHNANMAGMWRAAAEGLARALAEIGKFTFCDGPNCPFCEWGEHPPSKEAIIAAAALATYESYKKGEQP
jgi:hypothetical protein